MKRTRNQRVRASLQQQPALVSALLYIRVSSAEQAREGLSLPAQLERVRRYAEAQGWDIGAEYQDVLSGRRSDRPGYQALLADARRRRAGGEHVVIVVNWMSRLGRNVRERVTAWEEMDSIGVAIYSVVEGHQTKLVHDILAATDEQTARDIGDKVASTWLHTTSLGWAKTSPAPWGYYWRPATPEERAQGSPKSVLDIQPDAAPFVKEAFERIANGEDGNSVTRWAAALPAVARGGRPMGSLHTLRRIMRSPKYVARHDEGSRDVLDRPRGRWPALVSDELWMAAQRKGGLAPQASGRYVLTGFVRCGQCGERMRGETLPQGPRYRCSSNTKLDRAGPACSESYGSKQLERLVREQVRALIEPLGSDAQVRKQALRTAEKRARKTTIGSAERDVQRLQAQIETLRMRSDRATERWLDGELDRETYKRIVAAAGTELNALGSELSRARILLGGAEYTDRNHLVQLEQRLVDVGRDMAQLELETQRLLLSDLVRQVTPHRVRFGVYRVEIDWTALGASLQQVFSKKAAA